MTAIPQGLWLPPRTATLVVAASNSSDRARAQADYVCNGVDDQVEIQAAIDALPAGGGKVVLSEGTFILSAQIQPTIGNVELAGIGRATILQCTADHRAYYADTLSGLVVRSLTVDTNSVAGHGIYFTSCNDIIVDSIWFINPYVPAGTPSPHSLSLNLSYNFSISNLHLTGGGVTASQSYDGVISDSYIMGANCAHFIAKTASHGIDFVNCWCHTTYHGGIYIDEGSYDCHIIGGSYTAVAGQLAVSIRGARNVVAFVDASESAGNGIGLESIDGCGDIEDNLIIGCDAHGLAVGIDLNWITGAGVIRRNKALDCDCRDCTTRGIMEHDTDAEVYDNTFLGNDVRGCAAPNMYQGEATIINSHEPVTTITVAATDADQNTRNQADYICDGTADEVQINAAIAALPAGGGEVVLSEGTFTLAASIDITDSDIMLSGRGRATIITTATDNLDIIYAHGGVGTELTNIIMRDFLVRGKTAHANDHGIYWNYVDESKIINVWSEHNGEYGMYIENSDHCGLEGIHCFSNNQHGLGLRVSSFTKVIGAVCNENVRCGIELSSAHGCEIIAPTCNGNDTNDTGNYDGLYYTNVLRGIVTGPHCEDNHGSGIRMYETSYISITGGFLRNNDIDGLLIAGDTPNADYNIVMGVVCTGNLNDGIEITEAAPGDSVKNIIVGNQLLGNAGAPFTDGGTNTEVGHNVTV